MSRSRKKPYRKDSPRNQKKSTFYWRTARRVSKQAIREGKDIPLPKEIVNDYDYCDWVSLCGENCWHQKEYGYKKHEIK